MDLNSILGLLDNDKIEKMSNQSGLNKNQTVSALSAVVPTLLTALKGNSQSKLG